jgi:hypothetical protein
MRVTTVLRRLLGVTKMFVESALFRLDGTLALSARPTWRRSRCGKCGRVGPRYDRQDPRDWRHLPWGRTPVVLRYAPWRVNCPQCGVRVEQVPWAASRSRFSEAFEELVAYFAQITDKTQVTRLVPPAASGRPPAPPGAAAHSPGRQPGDPGTSSTRRAPAGRQRAGTAKTHHGESTTHRASRQARVILGCSLVNLCEIGS